MSAAAAGRCSRCARGSALARGPPRTIRGSSRPCSMPDVAMAKEVGWCGGHGGAMVRDRSSWKPCRSACVWSLHSPEGGDVVEVRHPGAVQRERCHRGRRADLAVRGGGTKYPADPSPRHTNVSRLHGRRTFDAKPKRDALCLFIPHPTSRDARDTKQRCSTWSDACGGRSGRGARHRHRHRQLHSNCRHSGTAGPP